MIPGDGLPALEDVDDLRVALRWLEANHEMTGQCEPDNFQPDLAGELHVDHRQRDRQSLAVIDHAAQVAVGPVIVVGAAAVKAVVLEQMVVERRELLRLRRIALELAFNLLRHSLDVPNVGFDVEVFFV